MGPPLLRGLLAAALSYTFTGLSLLGWHYLPGPVHLWQLLLGLNGLALLPLLLPSSGKSSLSESFLTDVRHHGFSYFLSENSKFSHRLRHHFPLWLILLVAIGLRFVNLGYSEFQGDEALAMLAAAEALSGHETALFLRAKGPGEVLFPMALWRLTGTTTEALARLPFALATLGAILTIYLIGKNLGGSKMAGWWAAGFFAANGFMVAFGRIVQYQALVVWFSSLAFLLLLYWRQTGHHRLALMSGLLLGSGLLAHYDAILVLPALIWLLSWPPAGVRWRATANRLFQGGGWFMLGLALTTLPFYLPYSLDPQLSRTGDYVSQRIGQELRNNLPDFFHFNTFYSSFYYLTLTSLLIVGYLMWLNWPTSARPLSLPKGTMGWRLLLLVMLAGILTVVWQPTALEIDGLNLTILPFAWLILAAFISQWQHAPVQATLLWLAVPFLGYNFVVAVGLTHIYTIVPAGALLAGLAMQTIAGWPWPISKTYLSLPAYLLLVGQTIFLANAFIQPSPAYLQDYPAGNLSLFWSPYREPPATGFFGFVHRAGWKAVGQKIVSGELVGDYRSNEEPDVTTWYTRAAPRACDQQPEFYFLADDLVDPIEVPTELLATQYDQVGRLTLPNGKQMRIMQQKPTTLALGQLNEAELAQQFDRTTTPKAVARSSQGTVTQEINFGHRVRLIGYDLDSRRAYPSGRIMVTLYWQALASLPESYHVFTHLENEAQGVVAQADGLPVCWSYPTDLWRPGQVVADQRAIAISPDVPPNEYRLEIGWYLPTTGQRLDWLDVAGNPAGTSFTLTHLVIK